MSADNNAADRVLKFVEETWHLTPTDGLGCKLMWRREKLHSIAYVGVSHDRSVLVTISGWTMMRMIGDRMGVPTAVYCDLHERIQYCSWPVVSGLKYPVVPDAELGGWVVIPQSEFKDVARAKGSS